MIFIVCIFHYLKDDIVIGVSAHPVARPWTDYDASVLGVRVYLRGRAGPRCDAHSRLALAARTFHDAPLHLRFGMPCMPYLGIRFLLLPATIYLILSAIE